MKRWLFIGWLVAMAMGMVCGAAAAQRDTPVEPHGEAAARERARQRAVEVEQTRARIARLQKLEEAQREQSGMEARSGRELPAWNSRADLWAAVLRTNQATYEALRQEAALSPRHLAHCTICDGRGSLSFCVVCGGSGKCLQCMGTGQEFGQACPTCRGTGKCYLCFGTGRMTCPFCDDGDVYVNGAPPPASLPAPGVAVSKVLIAPKPVVAMHFEAEKPGGGATAPHTEPMGGPPPALALPPRSHSHLGLGLGLLLLAGLAIHLLIPRIGNLVNRLYHPWAGSPPVASGAPVTVLGNNGEAEAEAISTFAAVFQVGPAAPEPDPADVRPELSPLERARATAPEQIRGLRALVEGLGQAEEPKTKETMLGNLNAALVWFKSMVGLPELLPAWQLTYALECLVKQLLENPDRIAPPILRTISIAVDLLENMCRPGVRLDLCTYPAMRMLAVDDDAMSRHAISLSLKKALEPPDLANDAEAALALIEHHAYDVIFLDIELPGMSGLELCARIRETRLNRAVPVVFVTSHTNEEMRAKMAGAGGTDLLEKPFLIFELTVKALTMVLHGRLHGEEMGGAQGPVPRNFLDAPAGAEAAEPEAQRGRPSVGAPASVPACRSSYATAPLQMDSAAMGEIEAGSGDSAASFRNRASVHLRTLEGLVAEYGSIGMGESRRALLQDLLLGVRVFTPMAELGEVEGASQISSSLEGLLREMIAQRGSLSHENLQAVISGLRSLRDLCQVTGAVGA